MVGEMKLYVFGDHAPDRRTFLQTQLLAGRASPLLRLFLQKLNLALRREVANLSPHESKNIPSFSTIEELVDGKCLKQFHHVGVESALLCISQLAHYIE